MTSLSDYPWLFFDERPKVDDNAVAKDYRTSSATELHLHCCSATRPVLRLLYLPRMLTMLWLSWDRQGGLAANLPFLAAALAPHAGTLRKLELTPVNRMREFDGATTGLGSLRGFTALEELAINIRMLIGEQEDGSWPVDAALRELLPVQRGQLGLELYTDENDRTLWEMCSEVLHASPTMSFSVNGRAVAHKDMEHYYWSDWAEPGDVRPEDHEDDDDIDDASVGEELEDNDDLVGAEMDAYFGNYWSMLELHGEENTPPPQAASGEGEDVHSINNLGGDDGDTDSDDFGVSDAWWESHAFN